MSMGGIDTKQRQKLLGWVRFFLIIGPIVACFFLLFPGISPGTDNAKASPNIREQRLNNLYPDESKELTIEQCMQCHPDIATLLRTNGAMHSRVQCTQCHLQFHNYVAGKTNYEDILPKCTRCHGQPHGEELQKCSNCHQEAHAPLNIPAGRSLSQGCYVCHPEEDKDIKTYINRHGDLYCTACHHTKHGYIPDCLECHQQHTGTVPEAGRMTQTTSPFDQCLSCHPPHKALKVVYPDDTPNSICTYCHRNAGDMLHTSKSKHTELACIQCHPGQHKTIKRCEECHGRPHPDGMLENFSSCGGCHGVAHSVVR